MAKRGYKVVRLDNIGASGGALSIYTNQKVRSAYEHLKDMTLYDFTRVLTLAEAAYNQGRKDGAAVAFGLVSQSLEAGKKAIPSGRPGRPKKTPRKKGKKSSRSKARRHKKK